MPDLNSYRNVINAVYATPPFRRYLAMMQGEPSDTARLSVIEEWRRQTIALLRTTLDPKGRSGRLSDYKDNIAWSETNKPK